MRMRSARLATLGAAALVCASALAPAAQAQDFFSALFGGLGGGRARHQPYVSMPFANDDGSVPVQRREMRPRYAAVVVAVARRFACGPATGVTSRSPRPTRQAGRLPATASARRAKPRCSTAAASTTRLPITANPIRSCRTPSAIATNSSAAAPATARTRSDSRRSRSRTTRRCARATSSPATNGLLVAGRSADKRGAELNFSPASERVRSKYERLPVVARE